MRRSLVVLVALLSALTALGGRAHAQYMYLDANGDGVWSVADRVSPNGTPVTVDVWLRTNVNRDGSPGICPTADGALTINSYVVNLAASGGVVNYSGFVNRQPAMTTVLQPFASSTTEMTVGYGAGLIFPPGDFKLFTVTITPLAGSPIVSFTGPSGLQPYDVTSFGCACSGNDFDNTMKLGSDWFDADGLLPAGGNSPPIIVAPANANGVIGASVILTGSASDPDAGDNITLSQTNNTPFFPVSSSSGPSLNPSITLTATPIPGQAGNYTVNWTASDSKVFPGTSAATTALHVGPDLSPPAITAPSTVAGTENAAVSITASASDFDANLVTLSQTNNAAFLSGPALAGPVLNPSLTLSGTPNFNQAGAYTINWTAVDNSALSMTTTATTALTIANQNRAPVITAPLTLLGQPFVGLSITGSATDPDAMNVTLSQTNNAPFLTGPSSAGPVLNPSITLTGTPGIQSYGSYTIFWTAIDSAIPAGSGTAATSVVITQHRPPIITAPATVEGFKGVPLSITASAASVDFIFVTLCATNVPAFLTGPSCVGPNLNPTITISGTPGITDSGSYVIHWSATDASNGTAAATTTVTIADSNRPPVLNQPDPMTVDEGSVAVQQLTASDPEGNPLTFSKVGVGPLFMTVSPSGLVTLAPGYVDAGSYTGSAMVSDGTLVDAKSFAITVVNSNRCPVADPGGPYPGVVGAPVTFNGTGSSDPDGDALTYFWNFGDRTTAAGAIATHIYTVRQIYFATLTVDDGVCSAHADAPVSIEDAFTASAFTTGGNKTTSLGSGKPFTCVEVEPAAGAFDVTNVNLASLKMVSYLTGSVSEIAADAGKTDIAGDKNGNGVTEIQACFAKEDLRLLFSGLPSGRNDVPVAIAGSLTTGGSFVANLILTVKSTGGALAANISPNPLNPSARLTYTTSKAGAVRVALYDLNGRLVRTYLDAAQGAGTHDVTIDGRGENGERLASSVYFLKIRTESDGEETKSLTILK